MTIKELNKLIKEELDAFIQEDEEDAPMDMGDNDMGDDIEVTTDEPEAEEDPLDLLRQIYDMLKPIVDDEEEMGDEGDMEDMESGEEDEESDGDEEEEGDEDSGEDDLKEYTDPLAVASGVSNTGNALSQLTGIPMNVIVLLLVFGLPITYMLTLQGIELIKRANVPEFVKRAAMKAASLFQKSGKSGEEIGSEVEALQSKGEAQVIDALGSAEGMNESLDNFTDEEKMKFIKNLNAGGSGMMNESVKTRRNNRKLNESRQLKSRFQKLANIKK